MTNIDLLTVVNGPSNGTELSAVVLHGYAMQPETLAPFARSMGAPGTFHFPRAPHDVPDRGGRTWWPIDEAARVAELTHGARDLALHHPTGRPAARAVLASILRDPARCPPGAPRVLAGFSQGGMLAIETLLHEAVEVDGLVLFSSSRLAIDEWQPRRERLRGLPVLITHGRHDADLAFEAGLRLRDWLDDAGAQVRWLPLEAAHEIPLQAWRAMRGFLRERCSVSRA